MSTIVRRRGHQVVTLRRGLGSVSVQSTLVAPVPAASFELAARGSPARTQLVRYQANGGDWRFDDAPLVRVHLVDGASTFPATGDKLLTPANFASESVVQDASSFTITWTDATNGTLRAIGALSGGRLSISADFVPGAGISGTRATAKVQRPYLRVKPPSVNAKSQLQVVFGDVETTVSRDATAVKANDLRVLHGPQVVPERCSLGIASFGAMQFAVLQDPRGKRVLSLRGKDPSGRYKEFGTNGDGSDVLLWADYLPPNNLAMGTGVAVGEDYGVELAALAGNYYDAVVDYRGRQEAASAHPVSRGKLSTVLAPGGPVSQKILNANFLVWLMMHGVADTQINWDLAKECVLRLRAEAGLDPIVLLYGWNPNGPISDIHTWFDMKARAKTFLDDMAALGVPVGLYAVHHLNPAASWYTTPGTPPQNHAAATGDPGDLICLKPDQSPYPVLSGDPSTSRSPQLGAAGARAHFIEQLKTVKTSTGKTFHGFYLDAFTNTGPQQDYRTTNPNSAKGPGSDYGGVGARDTIDDLLVAMRTTLGIGEFFVMTEFGADGCSGKADLLSVPCFDSATLIASLPTWPTAYSQYQPSFGFDSYHTATVAGAASLSLGVQRDIRYAQAYNLHFGKVQMFIWADPAHVRWVGQVGDSDYQDWLDVVKKTLDWGMTLVKAQPQLRKYFRGRRLRPLQGFYDDHVERNGWTNAPVVVPPVEYNPTGACPMASAWQTDEEAGSPVMFLVTNHKDREVPFVVRAGLESHPELHGKRRLYETNPFTGARTLVKQFVGPLVIEGTIEPGESGPLKGVRMFEATT